MIQSTTKGVLHFEDLDPMMFERMYLNILDTDGLYEDIRSYGIKGSDEGVDILCSEKGGTIGISYNVNDMNAYLNPNFLR